MTTKIHAARAIKVRTKVERERLGLLGFDSRPLPEDPSVFELGWTAMAEEEEEDLCSRRWRGKAELHFWGNGKTFFEEEREKRES